MTATAATTADFRPARAAATLDLSPNQRALVLTACLTMSGVCLYAIMRGLLGLTPELPHLRHAAIVLHVATVLPCIPLGGYLLLTRKGTARHKQLGKLWLLLMLATAVSAIFIKTNGSYSFIHLFVPMPFHAAWRTVATARAGDIAGHKKHLVFTYLAALMLPGIAAFALEGRLMNVLLFG